LLVKKQRKELRMKYPPITDAYGRMFKTLRVSLTNTCNLGCVYCVSGTEEVSETAVEKELTKVLGHHEILLMVNSLHSLLNLEVIRLTGGEPTLYRELIPLIKGLKAIGIPFIKMTSNAFLLKNKAKELAEAGLSHINISLDAIHQDEFFRISRRKNVTKVIEGIDEAINSGIEVKLNCVVMKGLNDNQILPLLDFCFERGITIRFLELMKMGHLQKGSFEEHFYSQEEVLNQIKRKYNFERLEREKSSTANYWTTEGGNIFGIVANESTPFCADCNRLRLDSFGNIYGCLSEDKAISIKNLNSEEGLVEKLTEALGHKQKVRFKGSGISMLDIGG